jgi:protein-S-isoprenylcysteine O-methyltransferase Ste14
MRRFFAVLRSLVVASLFVSLWTWLLPRWIGMPFTLRNPAGWVPIAVGGAICVACFWQFGWSGLGTPAPFDPPRRLVVAGPYRWVRNPMYLGFLLVLIGEAILVGSATPLILAGIGAALVVPFVMFYEEPHLRGLFGGDYEAYCRQVRRWLPGLRPYSGA